MVYHIFISHSWKYSNEYNRLVFLLSHFPYFSYKDYSVPINDPIHSVTMDYLLKVEIKKQMQHASCVLVLAGMYAQHSKWINIEIQIAKEMKKPIIAVEPHASQRTSLQVKAAADKVVRWNTASIVSAIRELC